MLATRALCKKLSHQTDLLPCRCMIAITHSIPLVVPRILPRQFSLCTRCAGSTHGAVCGGRTCAICRSAALQGFCAQDIRGMHHDDEDACSCSRPHNGDCVWQQSRIASGLYLPSTQSTATRRSMPPQTRVAAHITRPFVCL